MAAWACPACGGANPADTTYCGACAALRAAEEIDALWTCDVCGAHNTPEGVFCGHCGEARAVEARHSDERRLVTALFADISGFTTLADRLEDPEALHGVIAPVIAGLAAIAERYQGTIAKYAGDAILVFFGAPIAREDDAVRALLVAIEMHAALPSLLNGLPEEAQGLELHIGVNSGRVIAGQFGGEQRADYSILGDAVNVAQRLESVAPSGSTFVGEATHALTEDQFAFEDMGDLELKGKLRPVRAWRLVRRRVTPAMAEGLRSTPLIGRTAELAIVDQLLDGLAAGRGSGVVTMAGEPGVGKTRLLVEAELRAEQRDVRWFPNRCPSYGSDLAYWPFAELVRRVAGIRVDHDGRYARVLLDRTPGVSATMAPYLARMIGAETAAGELVESNEEIRRNLHQAVVDWLVTLAQEKPMVVVIEDVQWIDKSSIALCVELCRVTHGWPLALVLTSREEGIAQMEAMTTGIEHEWISRFHLGPLDHDAILVFLTELLAGEPPPELVRAVEARTGGNPLFVNELVRGLIDDHTLLQRNGRWRMRPGFTTASVPDTVERVLASRIDLLSEEAARVLQTASVIGRLVRMPLLRALIEDNEEHAQALAHLQRAQFLDRTTDGGDEALFFHHALIQEVAYGRLLKRNRVELHRRVAEAAERLYGTDDDVIDLLARHSYLGARGALAVDYLSRAADRGRKLFANDEAALHLQRAIELVADDPRMGDRLSVLEVGLADLHNLSGNYDEAHDLYARIAPRDGVEAWVGWCDVLRKQGEYDRALEVAHDAIERFGDKPDKRAGLLYQAGYAQAYLGRWDDAISSLDSALEGASTDDATLGAIYVLLANGHVVRGDWERADECARIAEATFERTNDLRGLVSARRVLSDALAGAGRLDASIDALHGCLELARRTGNTIEVGGCLLNLGLREHERENFVEAIDFTKRALAEFERIDHGAGQALGYGNLADYLLRIGDYVESERYCELAIAKATAIGQAVTVADATLRLALVREQQGRTAEAIRLAEDVTARLAELGVDEVGAMDEVNELLERLRAQSPTTH